MIDNMFQFQIVENQIFNPNFMGLFSLGAGCRLLGRIKMQASADKIWGEAQLELRTLLNTDIYNLWFLPIKAVALEGETMILEVANDFCEVWLKDNYLGLISDVLAKASGQNLKVKFRVNPAGSTLGGPAAERKAKGKAAAEPSDSDSPVRGEIAFNPKNTFESFVVGENNNHAHAAAMRSEEHTSELQSHHDLV